MSNSSLWQTLLAACRQDYVNPIFNERNFPLEPVAPDEDEWGVYEHHFDKVVRGEEGFEELEKLGYRLLNGPRRAMEFIAEHPDLQLDHPLIVAARWQDPGGDWYAPIFYGGDVERGLGLGGLGRGFRSHDGWLVLRRKQK